MAFVVDRQTFDDLEILDRKGAKKSLFRFFDRAITHGGREALLDMFYAHFSDIQQIRERQEVVRFVSKEKISLSKDKYLFSFIELYLETINKPVIVSRFDAWHKALKYRLKPSTDYYINHLSNRCISGSCRFR